MLFNSNIFKKLDLKSGKEIICYNNRAGSLFFFKGKKVFQWAVT